MGGVNTKCNNAEGDQGWLGATRALEASSSEYDEEEESEDHWDDCASDDEQRKINAENAIDEEISMLRRGKTQTFKEVLDQAIAAGVDQDKIMRAEQALEYHRFRCNLEAFEEEVRQYLEGPDRNRISMGENLLAKGEQLGLKEESFNDLQVHLKELRLVQDLDPGEDEAARRIIECCVRRFVHDAIAGKRNTIWVNIESERHRAHLSLDLTLKNLKVVRDEGNIKLGHRQVDTVTAVRAVECEEINTQGFFLMLSDSEKERAVAIPGGRHPWLFVEEDSKKQEELLLAFMMLSPRDTQVADGLPRKSRKRRSSIKGTEEASASPCSPARTSSVASPSDLMSPRAGSESPKVTTSPSVSPRDVTSARSPRGLESPPGSHRAVPRVASSRTTHGSPIHA